MDTARYAELFLTESQDNLSAINHALLELERTPTAREPVGALFRAVHTVKGMSATMGYAVVAELSHELETLLDLVRRGEREVTPGAHGHAVRRGRHARARDRAVGGGARGRARCRGDDRRAARCRRHRPHCRRLRANAAPKRTEEARGEREPGGAARAAPVTIHVTQEPNTPMPGVRAYLALERAQDARHRRDNVQPAADAFDADDVRRSPNDRHRHRRAG